MKSITGFLLALSLFAPADCASSQWAQTSGPCGASVHAFAVSGTNVFAGTSGSGVWRRPLTEMVSVDASPVLLPKYVSLDQNYPNPFNPSTTIALSVPSSHPVTLRIFDILGRGF